MARTSLQGKAIAAARLALEENVVVAANAIVALVDSERADAESKLAEHEAELAKERTSFTTFLRWLLEDEPDLTPRVSSATRRGIEAVLKEATLSDAARQQQKASAEKGKP